MILAKETIGPKYGPLAGTTFIQSTQSTTLNALIAGDYLRTPGSCRAVEDLCFTNEL